MSLTQQDVMTRLGACEPNYTELADMGPAAVPYLAALIQGDDVELAAKATYLASVIQTDAAIDAVAMAATHREVAVRAAAAGGVRHLRGPRAAGLVERLLDDPNAGVRKLALRAVASLDLRALEHKVRAIAAHDRVERLRRLAAGIVGTPVVEPSVHDSHAMVGR